MKRRAFLAMLGLSVATTTLSACAGTGTTAKKSEGEGGKVTELNWWSNHPGSSKDVEKELISRFEKENPEIKINLIDAGKDYGEVAQKFNAALTGSDLPDVVVIADVTWYNFAINGQLANVDELAKEAGVDLSSYVKPLYEDYAYDGGHYGMPFARSTPLFYYNKDAWKKAGLPDRGPKDWEEMEDWAEKLKKSDSKMKPFAWANGEGYLSWYFQAVTWSMGGAFSDGWDFKFTDDKTVKAVEWLKEFTAKEKGLSYMTKDLAMDFSSGSVASIVESTGSLGGVTENAKFEVGTAFLPNPTGEGACPTGGAGLGIPAGIPKERQLAAVKFIDFITNTKNTGYWSRNVGYMPVRSDATEDAEQKKFLEENPNFATAIEQLPDTRPQDNARIFLPNGDQEIGGALETIVTSRADVKKTLEDLQKKLEDVYNNQVKPIVKG